MNEKESPEHKLDEALSTGRGPALIRTLLTIATGMSSSAGKAIGLQAAGPAGAEAGELIGSAAGGGVSAIVAGWSEHDQDKINNLVHGWLKLQEDEIREIGKTLAEIIERLDLTDEETSKRLESPEYLRLMKKCFRDWSAAESEEKRVLIRNLLINAAGAHIVTDSVVNLFVRWIDQYSEDHFRVVGAIYNNQSGISRKQIWQSMYPTSPQPREDAPEADLFKLLIHDLSTGHIIRQHRDRDPFTGQALPKPRQRHGSGGVSAFDDQETYELTKLGEQFVHYTMTERVKKIDVGGPPE